MPTRLALPQLRPLDFQLFTGLDVPDPITFVVSPQWCNRPQLYPRQATLLKVIFLRNDLLTEYDHMVLDEWEESFRKSGNNGITPGIRTRMASLALQGYSYFREVLLVLGRRAGKGYVSALAMSYVLWKFMAKGDPQGHYGIDRDKQLALFVYAGKKQQARENLWKDVVAVVRGAPCFTPYISRALGENLTVFAPHDFVRMKKLAKRGIQTVSDLATFTIQPKEATLMSARGPASCVLAFDEMAHVVNVGANRSAEEVYGCLDPETPVLGADLVWRPLKDVQTGDQVVAIDEYAADGSQRKMRTATVIGKYTVRKKALRLTFDDGSSVVCSANHRWLKLSAKGAEWVMAGDPQADDPVPNRDAAWALWQQNRGVPGIAADLGLSQHQVRELLKQRGVELPGGRKSKRDELYPRAARMIADGAPLREAADQSGIPYQTLLRWHREAGADPGKNGPKRYHLQVGDKIRYLVDPWETDDTRDGGWLAGIYDGEGYINRRQANGKTGAGFQVGVSQNPGVVLQEIQEALDSFGFKYTDVPPSENRPSKARQLLVRGIEDCLRLLGQLRPHRLLSYHQELWEGRSPRGRGGNTPSKTIVAIEQLPEQELIDLETSEKTFVANGLISHNSATPSLDQFKLDGFIIDPSSPWQQVGQFYANWQMSLETDEDDEPVYPYMMMLQLTSWEIYYDWAQAHLLPMFPEDFCGDLDEYVDQAQPGFLPLKGAVQEFDDRMEKLERSNPDTFAVERRSQWQSVVDAYLDPRKVEAIFHPDLAMRSEAENLTMRYAGHADPSKVNDNFGLAIAHTIPVGDDSGLMKVRFDLIHHWMPSEFPDNTIDYLEVTDRLWDIIWGFKVDEFTFDQHNCLAADTLIPTTDGLLTLRELVDPGEDMGTGELRSVDREVQAQHTTAFAGGGYRKGVAATRKIRTKMGYVIEATPEHRVWVRKAKEKAWHPDREWGWRPAAEIEAGDWVSVRRNNVLATKEADLAFARPVKNGATSQHWGVFRTSPTRWEAYGRKDGQRVQLGYFATEAEAGAVADDWRQRNATSHRLTRYPETCTPELALAMGYLVAEGDVTAKGARFGNKDREALVSYGNALAASFGGSWDYKYTDAWQGKHSYGWVRAGGYLGRYFTALGVGGRSQEKTVPPVIRRSPVPVVSAFLRGLFEGDGGVTIARQDYEEVAFHTTSERLAHEVQQLLLALGVFSTNWSGLYAYKGEKRPYWRLKVLGPDILDFAEKVGFDCSRKQAKLAEAVDRVLARGDKAGLRRKNNLHGDELWVRVTDIQESEAECYDLSVPGPENFVSNGVIAHNSAMPIATLARRVREHRAPKRMDVHEETATSQHNWQVAECFKVAINQGWVEAPPYETAELELKFLQLKTTATTNRVVHQDTGPVVHDDVAKSMMEVTWRLLADQVQAWSKGMLSELKPVFGQQGGINPYSRQQAPDQALINQLSPAVRNMVRGGGLNPARNVYRRGRR